MSKELYEEALADVKKLKEVAEDNAKRALLEAVTPRIKDLIETQLLGEAAKDDVLHDEKGSQETDEEADDPANELDGSSDPSNEVDEADDAKVQLDIGELDESDVYELNMESARSLGLLIKSNADFGSRVSDLGKKVRRIVNAGSIIKESRGFKYAIDSTISEIEDTYSYLQEKASASYKKRYEPILENYYKTLKQLAEQKMNRRRRRYLSEADITLKLTGVPDDMELDDLGVDIITGGGDEGGDEEGGDEEDLDLDLGDEEGGDEEEGDEEEGGEEEELDLDLDDEEGDEEEEEESTQESQDRATVEIDEGMLRREIWRMKRLREEKQKTQRHQKGHGPGDVSDDFADDDLGDPFVKGKLREGDPAMGEIDEAMDELEQKVDEIQQEMHEDEDGPTQAQQETHDEGDDPHEVQVEIDEYDESAMEAVEEAQQSDKQSRHPGQTVESLQRRIRREISLQMEAKRKAQNAKKQAQRAAQVKQESQKKAQSSRRQGKIQTEKQALQHVKQANKMQKKMQESYAFYARRFNESVSRINRLRGVLAEVAQRGRTLNGAPERSAAGTSHLRTKLAETNLINTKLYYTNRLLQNESLTKRQKAAVIERLDEANSDREVKLVYESLIRTLQGSSSSDLTESVNRGVMGSSSRPARPASATLTEGFETERWARLAGIVK